MCSSRLGRFMEAFISSTLAVALAEIGDKTQLLALFLAARYGKPIAISFGVLCATLVNHALSAWLGVALAQWIPAAWIPWLIAGSFFAIAIWLLVPDKDDGSLGRFAKLGPFLATTILFFLAEIGDKTQIATIVLAARYGVDFWSSGTVVVGTTLGMLIANVPVIFAGKWLMNRLPFDAARKVAFGLFLVLAVATVVGMR